MDRFTHLLGGDGQEYHRSHRARGAEVDEAMLQCAGLFRGQLPVQCAPPFLGVWKLLLAVLRVCERNTLSGHGQLLRPSIVCAVWISWEPGFDVLVDVDVRVLDILSELPSCWWLRFRSLSSRCLVFCYFLRFSQYTGIHTHGLGTFLRWLVLLFLTRSRV